MTLTNQQIKIYSTIDLKNIDEKQLQYITKYSEIIYAKAISNFKSTKKYCPRNVCSNKSRNKWLTPVSNTDHNQYTLEEILFYHANVANNNLKTDNEKILFICHNLFRDNNKFLEKILELNAFEILNELINTYNYFDQKYENNHELSNFQKNIYYNLFIKKYNSILTNLKKYFFEYHRITNLNLIINKLFQINYFDNELYTRYTQTAINVLTKK